MTTPEFPEASILNHWAGDGDVPNSIDSQTLAGYSLVRALVERGQIDLDDPKSSKVSGEVLTAMSQAVSALSIAGTKEEETLANKIQTAMKHVQLDPGQTLANKIRR